MLAKLVDLEPEFVGRYAATGHWRLDSVEGAQGILFVCPKCGNHSVLCWFKNPRNAPQVPDDAFPRPGRWTFSGDTFDVLTLEPSVDLSVVNEKNPIHPSRCYWHGFIRNGEAT